MAEEIKLDDYEGRDLEVFSDAPNYYAWITESFRPYLRGQAAEIGAGIGTFSRHLLPHISTLDLFEPSRQLVPALQAAFKDTDQVIVHDKTLEHFLSQNEKQYDVIVMVNVLEHIEDDAAALQGLWQRLNPGGHLLLYVPALPFLYSRLDNHFGHFRRYTQKILAERLLNADFHIIENRYRDVLGVLPWYVINTLGRKITFSPSAVRLYDRVGVPITKFIEQYVPVPFGKNLVSIAQKPA